MDVKEEPVQILINKGRLMNNNTNDSFSSCKMIWSVYPNFVVLEYRASSFSYIGYHWELAVKERDIQFKQGKEAESHNHECFHNFTKDACVIYPKIEVLEYHAFLIFLHWLSLGIGSKKGISNSNKVKRQRATIMNVFITIQRMLEDACVIYCQRYLGRLCPLTSSTHKRPRKSCNSKDACVIEKNLG